MTSPTTGSARRRPPRHKGRLRSPFGGPRPGGHDRLRRPARQPPDVRVVVGALGTGVAALALGAAIGIAPLAAFLPYAMVVLATMLFWPPMGPILVFAGALFVLQRSEDLSTTKFAFLGLLVIVVVPSMWRALTQPDRLGVLRPLVPASLAFMLAVAMSLPVAVANGASPVDWGRMALPYLLVASAVFLAADLAVLPPKTLLLLIVTTGGIAALGVAVLWLSRRGISTLGLEFFAYPSAVLAALGFVTGAYLFLVLRRWTWGLVAAFSLSLVLVVGTRTNLTFLVGPLALFAIPGRRRMGFREFLGAIGFLAAAAAVLAAIARFVVADAQFFATRLRMALTVVDEGVGADASGRARTRAYSSVWDTWQNHPLLGVGPGNAIGDAGSGPAPTLDTPLNLLAHLGLVGLAAAVLLVGVAVKVTASGRGFVKHPHPSLIAVAFWAIALAMTPFFPIMEDRGFALALAALLALVSSWSKAPPRFDEGRVGGADTIAGDAASDVNDAAQPGRERTPSGVRR